MEAEHQPWPQVLKKKHRKLELALEAKLVSVDTGLLTAGEGDCSRNEDKTLDFRVLRISSKATETVQA